MRTWRTFGLIFCTAHHLSLLSHWTDIRDHTSEAAQQDTRGQGLLYVELIAASRSGEGGLCVMQLQLMTSALTGL
jgi:hypothetical protein